MSMPFDATLKDLGKQLPSDFLTMFDKPPAGKVTLLNIDLSTVTTSGDLIFGIGEPLKEILHYDFQASAAIDKGLDVAAYNVLLHRQYKVPVHSTLVLLRRKAQHSNVNGSVTYSARPKGKMDYCYELLSLWDIPAESFLRGPLGTLPLAVLGGLPQGQKLEEALKAVAQRIILRLEQETSPQEVKRLLTSAFLLTGLLVDKPTSLTIFGGVKAMRESSTYLGILDEGREDEAKRLIIRLARKKLGQPDEATQLQLAGISDLERLERIHDQAQDATSWHDLLATP